MSLQWWRLGSWWPGPAPVYPNPRPYGSSLDVDVALGAAADVAGDYDERYLQQVIYWLNALRHDGRIEAAYRAVETVYETAPMPPPPDG